jgi:hypothetical protein
MSFFTWGDLALIVTFGAIGSFIGIVFGVFALTLWHELRTALALWRLKRVLDRPRVLRERA